MLRNHYYTYSIVSHRHVFISYSYICLHRYPFCFLFQVRCIVVVLLLVFVSFSCYFFSRSLSFHSVAFAPILFSSFYRLCVCRHTIFFSSSSSAFSSLQRVLHFIYIPLYLEYSIMYLYVVR